MSEIYFEHTKEQLAELLLQYSPEQIFFLADTNTQAHCLGKFISYFPNIDLATHDKNTQIVPAGESYKNLEQAAHCWQQLIENKATIKALLVNIGGGVVSDLGGFVAANYKRGIDFINVPTSTLAMIDACYGGKTAINFHHYKNQIGSFAHPKAIYIDTTFLETLPERQLNNGFVESVKHHLLFNKNALQEIEQLKNIKEHCTAAWMQQSLEYKKAIVLKDPMDKKERQALNFGHSIGHAIEAFALEKEIEIYHGEAVLLGMMEELKIAEQQLGCPKEVRKGLMDFKQKFFPDLKNSFSITELLPYLMQDKKNDAALVFSLIKNVGEPQLFFKLTVQEFLNINALN